MIKRQLGSICPDSWTFHFSALLFAFTLLGSVRGQGGGTELFPGDLVIVGVNANNQSCGIGIGEDLISFFSFKPIEPGTSIVITDNGYGRCSEGLWGNSEGAVRMIRSGNTLPAGQVITFRFGSTFGGTNVVAIAPDNNWTCISLNGNPSVNMNAGGDQIFFMQGGTWDPGTVGAHNATYTGNVLFGFTTNAATPWSASCTSSPNTRSDLPANIECFSMAPTLATDFNKYAGPITAATQREWIIRIDDPANWNTYLGCEAYNGQGYDWIAAPIMPITAASFQAGKWTGAKDTDWFDCKNWDDARVPTIVTDVLIDGSAVRHCSVGISTGLLPGGTGECASLTITNSGDSRNLTVEENSSLLVNGGIQVERTAGAGELLLEIMAGAILSGTDLTLSSVNTGTGEAGLNYANATGHAQFNGNITIGPGGSIDPNGGRIELAGNWSDLASGSMFTEDQALMVFNGEGDQFISTNGFEEVFHDLQINKPSGTVNLNAPLAILGTLDLQNGVLHTTGDALLTMQAESATINSSDASFVHGPMQKIGLTAFTFPIGKDSVLRPCGLNGFSEGTVTDGFIAEYFAASPIADLGNALEPLLDHISDCEYWMIERSSGNANATVELSWDTPTSCGVNSLPALRVGHWNGSLWRDRGNGEVIGNDDSGTIRTGTIQDEFGAWTLASVNFYNPLPITLIAFDARAEGNTVRLNWQTGTEENNDHFTIERSEDGVDFEEILVVPGAGTSYSMLNYTELDPSPRQGFSYYRLRQTDHDGSYTYSPIASVFLSRTDRKMVVLGSAEVVNVLHDFGPESHYGIMDLAGRMLFDGTSDQHGLTEIPVGSILPSGAYIFQITDGTRMESVRFVH